MSSGWSPNLEKSKGKGKKAIGSIVIFGYLFDVFVMDIGVCCFLLSM